MISDRREFKEFLALFLFNISLTISTVFHRSQCCPSISFPRSFINFHISSEISEFRIYSSRAIPRFLDVPCYLSPRRVIRRSCQVLRHVAWPHGAWLSLRGMPGGGVPVPRAALLHLSGHEKKVTCFKMNSVHRVHFAKMFVRANSTGRSYDFFFG